MKLTAHPLAELKPAESRLGTPTDQNTVARLQRSLDLLTQHGEQLSSTFYELLFHRHPFIRQLFPQDMEMQKQKLMQTLIWVVTHLDKRDQLLPALRDLGRRHLKYGAMREHYPLVRDAMLDAMSRTAGVSWTSDLAEDWRLSFDLISRHMLAATVPAEPTLSVTVPP